MQSIAVIGDGGWGTALALHLNGLGRQVKVWGPFPGVIADIVRRRENHDFLPGVALPDSLQWTSDPDEALRDARLAVLAVPSKYCRDVFALLKDRVPAGCALLSVSKGLDGPTGRRLTELAGDYFPRHALAALSGPSHAEEVARGMPTAVAVAATDAQLPVMIQALFMGARFRVYTSDDIVGTELGGAFKNVIALAVGASDGLGFGDNTRAALITRGLAEITRLGCAMGARAETFAGLSGMGDLIVTCTSRHSRNRAVGERLGRGERIEAISAAMPQVAEGVTTCATAWRLGREHDVRTPIINEVYALIHEGKSPQAAVQSLLDRDARPEMD